MDFEFEIIKKDLNFPSKSKYQWLVEKQAELAQDEALKLKLSNRSQLTSISQFLKRRGFEFHSKTIGNQLYLLIEGGKNDG